MRIKRSKEQDRYINELTNLFEFKYDGIISRIAFTYSLRNGNKFDSTKAENIASDGKEFRDVKAVFGTSQSGKSYYPIYKAILDEYYEYETTDEEFSRYFKIHLDEGLKKLKNEIDELNITKGEHVEYLAKCVNESLTLIEQKDSPRGHVEKEDIDFPEYKNLVDFELGTTADDNKVSISLNDLNEFDSHHIAIAGMTGAGKTQLIKDILYQISKNTANNLNYIYFDYKGEGNPNSLNNFLDSTNAKFVDLLNDEFDFNPLEYISLTNEREQNFQIQSFIDSVRAIETQIGVKQEHHLKQVIKGCFDNADVNHPDLNDIERRLEEYYEENNISPDSLLSTISKLSSGLFNREDDSTSRIFDKSIYLNLPITLADTTRQLCVFLILKYLLEQFSRADDTRPENSSSIKPLRYIIVIDEAHVYLKNKNARKILEQLLRVIRSKGVVVVMLSQGIEDYKRKDFDFSSQVKIPICLNIKTKDTKSLTNFLGTPSSQFKLENAASNLENGKGLVNFKEPTLFEIRQFYKTIS
jgi:DNA sulfur modification protein DndE